MKPQAELVLNHIRSQGSITGVEAEAVHKVRHLPSRIFEIKKSGIAVVTEFKLDATGQRYARYSEAK